MAGDRGASLPVAALGVLAVFFSTALLSHYAFDIMRLGEGEATQERSLQPPPVEARLWEDPLAAVVRHRDVVDKQCSGKKRAPSCDSGNGGHIEKTDILVVVPMPGSSFVGGEEQRRRIRYAVLAGLASKGFVPEYSSRLGLMSVPWCKQPSLSECALVKAPLDPFHSGPDGALHTEPKPANLLSLDVAYETLKTERNGSGRRATVLWLDDTKIGPKWLTAITVLVAQIQKPKSAPPEVTIIGPFTSEKVVEAIEDLANMSGEARPQVDVSFTTRDERKAAFCANWDRLRSFNLVSPFSTADEGELIKSARLESIKVIDCPNSKRAALRESQFKDLDETFRNLLGHPARSDPFFLRTVGADNYQVEALKAELCARGIADGEGGRVVLFHEWDSLFARDLVKKIEPALKKCGHTVTIDTYAYFGGLDGVTLEGASKQQRAVPRTNANDKNSSKQPEIEWPENRDQRDYIRRLVSSLQAGAPQNKKNQVGEEKSAENQNGKNKDAKLPVRAVGVIGQDVHDKLLLIQALRPAFTERTIFTTDMDARLFHPETARYMRNVVISSALPLSLADLQMPVVPSSMFAPFRDSYQTANFLAAHYAALDKSRPDAPRTSRGEFRTALARQLETTYLHEVGRLGGAVALATPSSTSDDDAWSQQIAGRWRFALVLSVMLAIFGAVALVSMPSPALRKVVRRKGPCSLSTMLIAGLVIACWGFAVGVVTELGRPGRIGVWGVLGVAALGMAVFWMAFARRRHAQRGEPAQASAQSAQPYRLRLALVLLVPAAVACLLAFVPPEDAAGTFEPFSIFTGVSSWPSELLRALAVLLFGWFLDRTWRGTSVATAKIGDRYFPVQWLAGISLDMFLRAHRRNPARARRFLMLHARRTLGNAKIWVGRRSLVDGKRLTNPAYDDRSKGDGGIDGSRVWRNYLLLLADGPRFLRTGLWLAVTFIVIRTVMMLAGGEPPEIPARGEGDRALFLLTIWLSVTATVILMILVSDATILTWRFIQALRDKRTVYPVDTVRRFAADLGPLLARRAARAIAARPRDRNDPACPARNSIVDPWIDANLLADHTEGISRLIFFPLILLGLLFLARLQIFDNWSPDNVVMIVLVAFLLWMISVATVLNIGAEIARRRALETMRADLLWLKGGVQPKDLALAEQFPSLIKQVEELRRGAFAPFFEQPIVRAVLVPLSGVGGLQLIELLQLIRS